MGGKLIYNEAGKIDWDAITARNASMQVTRRLVIILGCSSLDLWEEEMKTLIFDNNAGHLQWISTREIYLEALKDFDAAVHIGPHNRGLKPADWKFYRVRDEKAKEIADWHEHGSPGASSLG